MIRLDIEIKWAGNPKIVLTIGTAGIPLNIELNTLVLTSTIRVELIDLIPVLPCIRAVSISCVKKPDINFDLNILHIDLMSLGYLIFVLV